MLRGVMANYRFRHNKVSYEALDRASQSAVSTARLRDTALGHNHANRLPLLYRKAEHGTAMPEDLSAAKALYQNIRKMNKRQRAKVTGGYDTLRRNAAAAYCIVAESVAKRAKRNEQEQLAQSLNAEWKRLQRKINNGNFTYKGRNADAHALAKLSQEAERLDYRTLAAKLDKAMGNLGRNDQPNEKTIDAVIGPTAVPYKTPARTFRIADYIPGFARTAAAGILGLFLAACGGNTTPAGNKNAAKQDRTYRAPSGEAFHIAETPYGIADLAQDKPVPETPKTPSPAPQPGVKKTETPKAPAPAPAPQDDKKQEKPAPEQTPAPELPKEENTFAFISRLEALAAGNFWRGAANAKLLVNLGDGFGLSLYGQHAVQEQDFSNGSLDGTITRAGIGAFKYFDLNDQEVIFAELGAWYEQRAFDFENGWMKFGNDNTWHAVAKLGYAKLGDFTEDEQVLDNSVTKLLFSISHGKGDMTKTFAGQDYTSLRLNAGGHFTIADGVKLGGGISYQDEELGDDWENRILAAELGPILDLSKSTQLELKATYRDLFSEFQGIRSEHKHPGVRIGLKSRLSKAVELFADAGYEWPDKESKDTESVDGLGAHGRLGLQFRW